MFDHAVIVLQTVQRAAPERPDAPEAAPARKVAVTVREIHGSPTTWSRTLVRGVADGLADDLIRRPELSFEAVERRI